MKRAIHGLLALLMAMAMPASAMAATPAETEAGLASEAVVAVPLSRRIDFQSRINGRHYTAFVALPLPVGPPPARGYPVLYVLDGNYLFGTSVDVARTAVKSGVVVVGIGYPIDNAARLTEQTGLPVANPQQMLRAAGLAGELWRNHDLTLPASDDFIRRRPGLGITRDNVGGVDDFLAMIETELKPRVAALVAVDPANQALFGHSFGGLAVVRALLTRPQSYRSFIAASPSLYWNDGAVLADEAGFARRIRAGEIAPRVLITVGGDESTPPPGADAQVLAGLRLRNMVANARDLASRLATLSGPPGYVARGVLFADEGHVSVQAASISRGVRFAFTN
jgi:predicted alpha/beta superfamily hydrolase